MKTFIALLFISTFLKAYAVQIGPQGRKSSYYYFELAPKEKLVLTFIADKICTNDSDKILVDEFNSTASYPSTEKKVNVAVRIKSIFVESYSVCSSHPIEKLNREIVIGPFESQMTHIRITTSDGVQVKQN